jgi:hypothetical protein
MQDELNHDPAAMQQFATAATPDEAASVAAECGAEFIDIQSE